MTFLVAYDGSPLAKSALLRASQYARAVEESVHVVTVVSADATLARERNWVHPDEGFDREQIEERARAEVHAFVESATVHCRFVEKHAARGRVTRTIRTVAKEQDITVLFVGSESAGHLVTGLASVGQGVAYGGYDLHVVRRPHPDLE